MSRINQLVITLFLLSLLMACASTNAPDYALVKPEKVPIEVYGGWIELSFLGGNGLQGELLAVDDSTLYMVSFERQSVQNDNSFSTNYYIMQRAKYMEVPKKEIRKAKVTFHDLQKTEASGTGVFISLTSFTHGWFALISLPFNILFTSAAAAGQTQLAQYDYDYKTSFRNEWKELSEYARFPGGMKNVNEDELVASSYRRGFRSLQE